jgi:cyclic beta-1,2-glucan synthetase
MPSLVMGEPTGSLFAGSAALAVREQIRWDASTPLPWGSSKAATTPATCSSTTSTGRSGADLPAPHPRDEAVVAPTPACWLRCTRRAPPAANLRRWRGSERANTASTRRSTSRRRACPRPSTPSCTPIWRIIRDVIVAAATAIHGGRMRDALPRPTHGAGHRAVAAGALRRATCWWCGRCRGERPRARVTCVLAPSSWRVTTPHTASPGSTCSPTDASVALTQSGGGWSRAGEIAITRYRADPTLDDWGSFIYLRDTRSGEVWSAAYQPTRAASRTYEASVLRSESGGPPPRRLDRQPARGGGFARGRRRAAAADADQSRPRQRFIE